VHRDYAPKGVKFFFVYKSLAHPELAGDYVQPFTLKERLAHAQQAEKQLGASVPWLVDAMDNRLKHALGDRPNSEFIIDPQGVIVRKRAWSHPAEVRRDLEQLVGPVDRITKEEDVKLKLELPKTPAVRGVVKRIDRSAMQALIAEPKIEAAGQPFFAKLRAEGNQSLVQRGAGKLYLGFHLDPFHNAHWNNLTRPLSYRLEVPEGVKIDRLTGQAEKVAVASDADPREFLLDVASWPAGKSIKLTVTYFACVGDTACHAVQQEYELRRRHDTDAGRARGEGAGYWDDEFLGQMLARDRDRDGKLNPSEVQGLVLPHFEHFDLDRDELLSREELKSVLEWLNRHHQPGAFLPADAEDAGRPK
jgi:hypothetical protein